MLVLLLSPTTEDLLFVAATMEALRSGIQHQRHSRPPWFQCRIVMTGWSPPLTDYLMALPNHGTRCSGDSKQQPLMWFRSRPSSMSSTIPVFLQTSSPIKILKHLKILRRRIGGSLEYV